MEDVSILHTREDQPEARLKEPEKLIKKITKDQVEGSPCTYPDLISNPTLNYCYKTPHQILPGWDT